MTDDQIKHMVSRFLQWRLPETFNPDGGISFKADFNEHTAHPMKHQPFGTNLLDAVQAEAMVRHMLEGMKDQDGGKPDKVEVTVGSMAFSPAVFVMPHGELSGEAKMKLSQFSAVIPALLNSGLVFDVFYNVDGKAIEVTAK